jgi:hypothetical protein
VILWTGKATTEPKVEYEHCGIRSWRWRFTAEFGGFWLEQQVRFSGEDGEWRQARAHGFFVDHRFRLGSDHVYWDGPHCGFSLGFLHFNWQPDWCLKCMPDDAASPCMSKEVKP